MQPFDIDYNDGLEELTAVLASVDRPGSFVTSGAIETPLPRLTVKGVGTIAFPLLDQQARAIADRAERAPYGRGSETLVDTKVRKVWQLGPKAFSLSGRSWKKTLDSIVERVAVGLGCPDVEVSAELYKMLLYDEGSFFVSHRDTEKSEGMFATLVVTLPSEHVGGTLVVRSGDREEQLDVGVEGDDLLSSLGYAAFYADCEHEVLPITRGHRLCLIYNLVRAKRRRGDRSQLQPPDYRPQTLRAAEILREWAADSGAPPKVVYLLEHQYTPAGLSFSGLKNRDAAWGRLLAEAASRADYAIHLGIVHLEESGSAEVPFHLPRSHYSRSDWYRGLAEPEFHDCDEFEIYDVWDASASIDEWRDTQDRSVDFGSIPLGRGELLPAGGLRNEKPDVQRVAEATGNEGGSFERAYHRAVIVLWPQSRYGEVLLQSGAAAAVPYLSQRVEKWCAGKRSRRSEAWREITTLTNHVIESWHRAPHEDSMG
ncbi:MAG: 2OG-Fe(II) oxygenase, partial [Planctomycetes bacterium]|nr:2OG-Fe(II) oxygenase [Planctomycetota bacterium]